MGSSSEMPVAALGMSDRIVVMREGEGRGHTARLLPGADPARGHSGNGGGKMRRAATFSESFRELGLLGFIVIVCAIFQIRTNILTLSNIRIPGQHCKREHPLVA